jgi:hypothetical protein
MALNFPSSPTIGQVYTDATSGFSYEWNGTVWRSYSPSSSSQIKVIDDISGSFNGATLTFPLTTSGFALSPSSGTSLRISLGGVIQSPGVDYSVSGTNIVFTTAPESSLSFSGISLGPAVPVDYANNGNVYTRTTFTATASQTTFTVTGSYTVGYLDVYQNGVRLSAGTDYTATNGTTFVLTTPAILNDEIESIGYKVATIVTTTGQFDNLNISGVSTFVGLATHTGTIFGNNLSLTGIATATEFDISGSSNTLTAGGLNVGVATASSVIVGSAVTINSSGINVTGITTIKNASGTVTIGIGTTALLVEGNARITGILTVGTGSITLDGSTNTISGITTINTTSINGGPLAGMRNAIINGNFDIWQRGTSFTGSEYGADRWRHSRVGTTHTVTQQPFTLGQTNVPGEPTYYCRTVVSSVAGAGNYAVLLQWMEDVRTFAGQQVTVSFWAKADATKNIAVELSQVFGSGGSPSTNVNSIGTTKISIGTTWQKVTVAATMPSISGKTLGTNGNSRLGFNIWLEAGSDFNARTDTLGQQSGTFEIAQVQLEPGPVATAFEKRPIGTELALCQRYFNKSYAVETNPGIVTTSGQLAGSFAASGTGSMHSVVRYPVVMRSTATVTVYNPVTGASNSARRGGGNVVPTQGSGADSGVIVIISGSSADNYAHHYTASAEL